MFGVYGGSFDPVHRGHVTVARHLVAHAGLEQVVFMPVWAHPLDKSITAPFDDRVAMLRIALANERALTVSELERELGGRSYTVALLQELDRRYGHGSFCFITGMDNLNTFFSWKNWEQLVREWPVVFTTRGQVPVDETAVRRIEDAAGQPMRRTLQRGAVPDGPVLLTVPDVQVSSTEIRKRILSGAVPSGMMDPKVLAYIQDQRLYGMER